MSLRTRIAGTVAAVVLAAILASCGGTAPTQETVDLKGQVLNIQSVSGFYRITVKTQDGRERTFSIDEKKWGGDERYKTLKANLDVGECVEVPGIHRNVVSSQMYVGPDLVKIVECK